MINKRLIAALEWINNDDILADIGCDHGYLSIMALKKGVSHAILVDNKEGPLNVAKYNVQNAMLIDKCDFILGDGITKLNSVATCIAILGMGGEQIIKILSDGSDIIKTLNQDTKFILQANTKIFELRKFLANNNFKIIDEMVVYDSNFYYELILCKKTNYKVEYSEAECLLGPILLQKKEKLFLQKWKEYLSKVELICTNNDKASTLVKKVTLIKESLCIK